MGKIILSEKQANFVDAIHEAGHAVIGRVLGLPCGLATLRRIPRSRRYRYATLQRIPRSRRYRYQHQSERRGRRKYSAGYAIVGPTLIRNVRPTVEKHILAGMAGVEAEKEFIGECSPEHWEGDHRQIVDLVRGTDRVDWWKQHEKRLRQHCRQLVRKHKEKIERVAQALLDQRTLSGEDIDRLIAS
jgi:hypothetical protein